MTEYQIEANTRRCAATGRELQPGEKYFSVLVEETGKFHRRDYSCEAWQGPPDGAFSFWAGRIPMSDDLRRPKIDDEMLLDCFHRLETDNEAGRLNFRYITALLLMRRKRLRFEEARTDGDREVLILRCARTGQQVRVVNPLLNEQEMLAAQEEVFKVLGWQ